MTHWNPADHLRAVLEHPYEPNVCFMCAVKLDTSNRTEEHVIPKWLQERYCLWNERLVLINGTEIPYRQLTIPCCFRCNNERLSPLENRIRAAFKGGYDAALGLPRFDVFRWLAKVFLGIMYKELSLLLDRSKPGAGSILQSEFVQRFAILHFWLQLANCNNETAYTPGSLWILPAQVPDEVDHQFDLKDDLLNGVMAIRVGGVAIIADFLENGVHQQITSERIDQLSKVPLHPLQFKEFVAMIAYQASLLGQESEVAFFEQDGQLAYAIRWWSTVKDDAIMEPWVQEDYARLLSFYTQLPLHRVYHPPCISTWLHDAEGNFVFWPLGEQHPCSEQSSTSI